MLRYTDYDKLSGRISGLTGAFDGKLKIRANMQMASSNETLFRPTSAQGRARPGRYARPNYPGLCQRRLMGWCDRLGVFRP